MKKFSIILKNGTREFSTFSTFSETDVFVNINNRKWNRVIIFLHGFPDTNDTFKEIWDVIFKNIGENVLLLAPSMRGYEESSIQGGDSEYQVSEIASDINSWIKSIVPNGEVPVHLFGHDWGSVISYKAAQLYPESITSMVCLAIPYLHSLAVLFKRPKQIYLSSYFLTMQLKSIYKPKIMNQSSNSYLDSLYRYWSPNWNYSQNDIGAVKQKFQNETILDSVTAYYRCILWPPYLKESRWKVDFTKVPTLILSGETDGCMDKSIFELDKEYLKNEDNVQIKILSKIGHFMHREDPVKVGDLACNWYLEYS